MISPYAAGGVQHLTYTTAGVLRTIETILGMPPLTPYDAGARPLDAAFRARPDLRPFEALPAQTDTEAVNGAAAYRARDSARLDFTRADAAPDAVLNDILWHAVKGNVPPPGVGEFRPTRFAAGFVYGYGPSFSFAFSFGGGGRPWFYEHRPFHGRPWNGHANFGAAIASDGVRPRGEEHGSFAGQSRNAEPRFRMEPTGGQVPGERYARGAQSARGAGSERGTESARGGGAYAHEGADRSAGSAHGGGGHAR